MRISDWSSDVCSSDLHLFQRRQHLRVVQADALIDFALLDRGVDKADYAEAGFVAAFHRGFHVVAELLFECHRWASCGGCNFEIPKRKKAGGAKARPASDRKSTRLNSSH